VTSRPPRHDEIDNLVGANYEGSARRFERRFNESARTYAENGHKVPVQQGNGAASLNLVAPVFNVGDLQDRPIPPRRWLAEGLVPIRNVTMLAGDGGLGKTLAAMQLATATVIGKPWLGVNINETGPAICVLCEDELDELHRRQQAINDHYGISFADLQGRLLWLPRVGDDNILHDNGGSRFGQLEETPLYHAIEVRAREAKAKIVILDSLHDLYGGDEIVRQQVRQFLTALRRLAIAIDGAVVFTAHPSADGLATGRGYSGSTAWNNAVRSRLYLTKGDDPDDDEYRYLKTMKNNYGPAGGKLKLAYDCGIFKRAEAEDGFTRKLKVKRATTAVLEFIRDAATQGTLYSDSMRAGWRYLPRAVSSKHPEFSSHAIKDAMERLLTAGSLGYAPRTKDSRGGLIVTGDDVVTTDDDVPPSD
jgi:RecA-family ATPase